MAVLSTNERTKVSKNIMSLESGNHNALGLTKGQLTAAVNAADDWVESNATSFNNALPTAAKNNLTARQKALLLSYVVQQRYINS